MTKKQFAFERSNLVANIWSIAHIYNEYLYVNVEFRVVYYYVTVDFIYILCKMRASQIYQYLYHLFILLC